MDRFQDRVRALMAERGESQAELARAIDTPRQTISVWISKNKLPRPEALAKLAEHYGVSPAWLQYGAAPGSTGDSLVLGDGSISIPRYDLEASCGAGAPGADAPALVSLVVVTPDWLERYAPGASRRSLSLLQVSGDSMAPTLADGDVVVVDSSQRAVRDDAIYALQYGGSLYIKRVQMGFGKILVISDNPAYRTLELPEAETDRLVVLGRVYACMRSGRL